MTPKQLQAEVKRYTEWGHIVPVDIYTIGELVNIIRAQQALLVEAREKCCEARSELLEHGVEDYELNSFIEKLKAATGDVYGQINHN